MITLRGASDSCQDRQTLPLHGLWSSFPFLSFPADFTCLWSFAHPFRYGVRQTAFPVLNRSFRHVLITLQMQRNKTARLASAASSLRCL